MSETLDSLTFRHPTMEDAQQVLDLMETCEVSEYGESDSDLGDLLHDWGQIDLNEDAWLVFTSAGDLAGYGGLIPYLEGFRMDIYISPRWRNTTLLEKLYGCCEAHARALLGTRHGEKVVCRTYPAHINRKQRNFFRRHGYELVKYHIQMHIDLEGDIQLKPLPENVALRSMQPGQDEHAIHALVQSAFDRPGRIPQPFNEWQEFMMRKDIFHPELWFLAVAREEIIGTCLCFQYGQLGWVRQLAVVEKWRRKGLGAALLCHAFQVFKERGCEKVALVVDSDNPNAYRFYQSLGMKKMRQYDQYLKVIS